MKMTTKIQTLILLGLLFVFTSGYAQLPIWLSGGLGVSFPDGGKHFNTINTHYPGPSFYLIGQTTWNHNWFDLDSLIIGAEISTHFANARHNTINGLLVDENLRFNSMFVNLSRYFTFQKYHPFCNFSVGLSTMNTSEGSFVLSMGGVIRGGAFYDYSKYQLGLSFGYNAPWIAFRNTLTGFWELSVHVRLLSKYSYPKKIRQVSSYAPE